MITTVGRADQFAREKTVSDNGIDMEIEFRSDDKSASGKLLFLQLKSGDSYLHQRVDGKDIFRIKNPRHVDYWADQIAPVMLVIRDSSGEIRWMEIRDHLRIERSKGRPIRQIEFQGERFDAAAILKLRKKILENAKVAN